MGGGDEEGEDIQACLLQQQPKPSGGVDDDHENSVQATSTTINRTGTLWTGVAHIITGVIGSGVLSLAWSIAQLGWIAGPVTIVFFAGVTLLSTFLLCDCYMSPDPEVGPVRHRSYLEAVNLKLGAKYGWVCGSFVYTNLYGIGIAYTVTSAISMRAIQESNCYHNQGHTSPTCSTYSDTLYMLLFGFIQIITSQIPNFHNIQYLSYISATMSFLYSFIGLGLGLAKLIISNHGVIKGTISGVQTTSSLEKLWLVSQALGDIAFAYPYALILLEIQDTLKSPPTQTMKTASTIAILVTTTFYLLCGGFGYAVFGDDTPGNLLTGFGFYEPYWLVDFANACVVVHLVGGYQIYSQPSFALVDKWVKEKYPTSAVVNREYSVMRVNVFRVLSRTVYVASTTGIAMVFPYFNQVLGVIGALNFWPLSIYFPVQLYFVQKKVEKWSKLWVLLQVFIVVCLPVTLFGITGSVQGLIAQKLS